MKAPEKMVKDYLIGSVFEYENTPLKVVCSKEGLPKCTDCYFSDGEIFKRGLCKFSCYVHKLACTPFERKDKKHVIFKS